LGHLPRLNPTLRAVGAALIIYLVHGACTLALLNACRLTVLEWREGISTPHLGWSYRGLMPAADMWRRVWIPFHPDLLAFVQQIRSNHVAFASPIPILVPARSDLSWWIPQLALLFVCSFLASWLLPRLIACRASRYAGRYVEWSLVPIDVRDAITNRATVAMGWAFILASPLAAVLTWYFTFDPGPIPADVSREFFPSLFGGPVAVGITLFCALIAARMSIRRRVRALPAAMLQRAARCRDCGYPIGDRPFNKPCPECGKSNRSRRLCFPGIVLRLAIWLVGGVFAAGWMSVRYMGVQGAAGAMGMSTPPYRLMVYCARVGVLAAPFARQWHVYWRSEAEPAVIRWGQAGEGIVAYRTSVLPTGDTQIICVSGWCPRGSQRTDPSAWSLKTRTERASPMAGATYFDLRFGEADTTRPLREVPTSAPHLYVLLGNQQHVPNEGVLYGCPNRLESLSSDPSLALVQNEVRRRLSQPE
jgi:hypothetical protein